MNKAYPNNYNDIDLLSVEEQPFDLKGFLNRYVWRYWWLFLLVLGLAFAGVRIYLRYATPEYETRSKLLIKQPSMEGGFSEDIVLQELGFNQSSKNLINEIEILRSRTLMTEVVEKLGLNITYFTSGRVRNQELYKRSPLRLDTFNLNGQAYGRTLMVRIQDRNHFALIQGEEEEMHRFGDPFTNDWGYFQVSYFGDGKASNTPFLIRILDPDAVAGSYAGRVKLEIVGGFSDVLQLSLRDPVPEKAEDILNTLVEVYNYAEIEDKNRVGRNTLEFIDERLVYLTQELTDVEVDVEEYKRSNEIAAEAGREVGLIYSQMNSLDEQLSDLQIQQEILESVEEYLLDDARFNELIPFSSGIKNAGISGLISEYNQKVLEQERLSRSAGEDNPILLQVEKEIAAQRNIILQSLRNVQRELRKSIDVLKTRDEQFMTKFLSVPRKERELLEIKRQQAIKENLYLYLLEKREETALSLAVTVPNSRVIDPARSGGRPVEPNEQLLYVMALFIGLTVPGITILLRELLNDSVQTEEDIQKATSAPLLGGIAYTKARDQLVVSAKSRTSIAEMFRLLRTNLQFVSSGTGSDVLLVTSASSGEGKSFITVNLGMSLALSRKKVILLGFDLRKPKLSQYIEDQKPDVGLTNYLIGEAGIEEILQQTTAHPDLYYIGSGPIPPNPAELLMRDRMDELFTYLRQEFDYILIDTPPIGMVTDALLLNKYSDTAIFVVRYGQTKLGALRIIEDIYQQEKLNHPVIVFNGFKRGGTYGYANYGYTYGNGYGYYEDDKKRGWWPFR